ncbi:tRNA lysidine(34) synthetase TilS [Ornithinimicrobium humiphilum]|uniref:tRNA(Ile)-lysidine synthase n=1 Tax=Ornithinimicrobium humiphilum TaxID=125288 RepID=A0A543KKG0_9MICO|nr:tRNA lysidine(34) synthetase TilS [Ornithinimicrobium humiphilum]TQM95558.1 tRNA(Ile)-lysidine synthase [Ornithinimicrobium humiphilum]
MPGPPPAVAAVRVAVRRALTEGALGDLSDPRPPGVGPGPDAPLLLVGCSGGADSLALAAGAAFVAPRLGWRAGAVVVDHGLQEGSAEVAATAAGRCRSLGLEPVVVAPVTVGQSSEGPEADARRARYAALATTAHRAGARAVLLGHTREDQAEQVLLGLARGSGARSLAGMPAERELDGAPGVLLARPLLGVPRATTRQACTELGLEPWEDPHNDDPRYARVRARRALADLGRDLGPGVVAGLARTADLLRDDADALDEAAATAHLELGEPPWPVDRLAPLPRAVRTRLWRRLALAAGSPGTDLTSAHLLAVDGLVTAWRGQGPLPLPGGIRAARTGDRVSVGPARS